MFYFKKDDSKNEHLTRGLSRGLVICCPLAPGSCHFLGEAAV